MCTNCETAFCAECISQLTDLKMSCPNRCPKNKSQIKEISRPIKKTLDKLLIRCKYNCEVPLLSYQSHIVQCENFHKNDVKCWNCGNTANNTELVEEKQGDYLNLKKELKELNNQKTLMLNEIGLQKEIEKLQNKLQNEKEEKHLLEKRNLELQGILEINRLKGIRDLLQDQITLKEKLKENNYRLEDDPFISEETKSLTNKEITDIKLELKEVLKKIENQQNDVHELQRLQKTIIGKNEFIKSVQNLTLKREIKNNDCLYCITYYNFNCESYIAAGSHQTIQIWNFETGGLVQVLKGHSYFVWTLLAIPERKVLISGGWDKLVIVWNIETGNILKMLSNFDGYVSCLKYTSLNNQLILITGSWDKKIKLWNIDNNYTKTKELINESMTFVYSLTLFEIKTKKKLASGNSNGIKVWDLEKGIIDNFYPDNIDTYCVISFELENKIYIASVGRTNGVIKVRNAETGEMYKSLEYNSNIFMNSITSTSFNGILYIFSCHEDNVIKVWNVKEGKCETNIYGHSNYVKCCYPVLVGNKCVLISGSKDETIRIWR